MKRRFASHLLYLPKYGFLQKYVVELENGVPTTLFPLPGELESTTWLPGAMALLTATPKQYDILVPQTLLNSIPHDVETDLCSFKLFWLTPFDIISLKPVAGTRHKQLL